MFERFSGHARQTVVMAQLEAQRLRHNYIGKEHLLLGLLAERQGVVWEVLDELRITHEAVEREVVRIIGVGPSGPFGLEDAAALHAIGIDLEEVRQAIEQSFGPGALDRVPATCGIPFTPKAKQALELADEEAKAVGHDSIGPEHILLGLLRSEGGGGGAVLDALDLDRGVVRSRILARLSRAG